MFWVGLATLIMLITGSGDDTREFRKRLEFMQKTTDEVVKDTARRVKAHEAIEANARAFGRQRERAHKIGQCVTKADQKYKATRSDYEKCFHGVAESWDKVGVDMIRIEKAFRGAVTPSELQTIQERVKQK